MNENFAAGAGLRNGDFAGENAKHIHSPELNEAILSLLYEDWLDEDPTADCFDFDPNRMCLARSLLRGELSSQDATQVQDHLISCSRCRFIYGTLRDEVPQPPESVPAALRNHLHSDGIVVFPGGEVAEETWEFGLLNELSQEISCEIVELIASQAVAKLKRLKRQETIIVCFGNPIHRCGKRLAAKLVEAGSQEIHVVMADDFFSPKLWCDPKELYGKSIVVFVDVVHTGGLLRRLCEAIRMAAPHEVVGLTVIDQSEGTIDDISLTSLWQEPPENRTLHIFYDEDRFGAPRFFDAASGRTLSQNEVPKEVFDRQRAQLTIEQHLRELGPLLPYIEETGALQCDKVIGGVRYPWVLDLLRLLSHEEARKALVTHAASSLQDLSECGSWCLVYPAERSRRAGVWAKAIGHELGWPAIGIGLSNRRHYRALTVRQRKELEKYAGAVVVDAAIRTGKTLQSFATVLGGGDTPLMKQIVPFYAFDGLFADVRQGLEAEIGTSILSLFRIPLGAPTDSVAKHCRQYFTDALQTLDDINANRGWIDVVKAYCHKKLAATHFPRKLGIRNSEANILRALEEGERGPQARLEHSCLSPKPSTVKQLDVSYALQEPRTRNVLHGFLCNSMPNEFIEWCALALSTQDDFEWFDKDWLILHKRMLLNPNSERWHFLTFIGYRMRQQNDCELLARAHREVEGFRRSQRPYIRPLFPEIDEAQAVLDSRCDVLADVLS